LGSTLVTVGVHVQVYHAATKHEAALLVAAQSPGFYPWGQFCELSKFLHELLIIQ